MYRCFLLLCVMFFFNDTATTEIYTLSLHDALPIFCSARVRGIILERSPLHIAFRFYLDSANGRFDARGRVEEADARRSEEHTSELQSRQYLVCRLLLEKKKQTTSSTSPSCRTTLTS